MLTDRDEHQRTFKSLRKNPFFQAGTQRCFNVVLRLILGRDVEQLIFSVEAKLLISMSEKQPVFNVVSTSDFNVERTSDFNVETTSDINFETKSYFNAETA